MGGGAIGTILPMVCTGPIRYCGQDALKNDIENLKAAAVGIPHHVIFMPSPAPSGVASQEHYRNEEEFFHALGAALRAEYKAIIDVGFLLQLDEPVRTDIFAEPSLHHSQRHNRALMFVEASHEPRR